MCLCVCVLCVCCLCVCVCVCKWYFLAFVTFSQQILTDSQTNSYILWYYHNRQCICEVLLQDVKWSYIDHTHTRTHTHTDQQTDIHTDRQTDKQGYIEVERQGQTDRQTQKQADKQTQAVWQTLTHTNRQTQIKMQTQTLSRVSEKTFWINIVRGIFLSGSDPDYNHYTAELINILTIQNRLTDSIWLPYDNNINSLWW